MFAKNDRCSQQVKEYMFRPNSNSETSGYFWTNAVHNLSTMQWIHYGDVIMGAMTSQITSFTIVYSTVYSGAKQRKHQSSASLALVRVIHRWPVNSPHKWPVTRNRFPFDDVIVRSFLCLSGCVLESSPKEELTPLALTFISNVVCIREWNSLAITHHFMEFNYSFMS